MDLCVFKILYSLRRLIKSGNVSYIVLNQEYIEYLMDCKQNVSLIELIIY